MKAQSFLQVFALLAVVLALLVLGMPAPTVSALDITPSANDMPWAVSTAWPTANPLTVGQPWYLGAPPSSGSSFTYPTATFTPTPAVYRPAVAPPRPLSVPATATRFVPPLPSTLTPWPTITLPSPPTVTPYPTKAVAVSSGHGSSPDDAINPTDTWLQINAGGSLWYRIGADSQHMDVWLDLNVTSNVDMAVYAPNSGNWSTPTGHGTPDKNDPTRLQWAGGSYQARGYWYALVTNRNPTPVQVKMGTSTRDVTKSCHSYWETVLGRPTYWTVCE